MALTLDFWTESFLMKFSAQSPYSDSELALSLDWFALFWLATAHSVMIMTLDWLKAGRVGVGIIRSFLFVDDVCACVCSVWLVISKVAMPMGARTVRPLFRRMAPSAKRMNHGVFGDESLISISTWSRF